LIGESCRVVAASIRKEKVLGGGGEKCAQFPGDFSFLTVLRGMGARERPERGGYRGGEKLVRGYYAKKGNRCRGRALLPFVSSKPEGYRRRQMITEREYAVVEEKGKKACNA